MANLTLDVDAIAFVKELYPRVREDDAAIERYRAAIDKLPPIVVARGRILVDGFHRWQAYKREGVSEIAAVDLGDISDPEIIRESIVRNAAHGQQLSVKDKANLAGKLWTTFGHLNRAERVDEIAEMLSVSRDSVERWTKDARQQELQAQKNKAWDMWLDCQSYREIGEAVGVDHKTIAAWCGEFTASAENSPPPASRQHFDIWNFQSAGDDSGQASYPGRMPPQVVENLLWFYTEPGQIVFDPFVGGGTTIDVCKAMGRRVWSSDRKPSTPTLPIHEHNILTGWPKDAPARADLVILDPPYWQQAKGKYSDSSDDLGNMELSAFYSAWKDIVGICSDHLTPTGRIAYIISPTNQDDHTVVDHATDMLQAFYAIGMHVQRRIIVPYQTQQSTGQQVDWARDNKRMLKLYRDLVVLSK